MKTQEKEMSWRGFYIPQREKRMSKILEHPTKKYALCYFQLKVGHDIVRTYLTRIGVMKTPQYW